MVPEAIRRTTAACRSSRVSSTTRRSPASGSETRGRGRRALPSRFLPDRCAVHPVVVAVHVAYRAGMCRNIKTLHNFKPPATAGEIRASSLQFVRKVSGFTKPSKVNEVVFTRAVDQVARAAQEL